LVQTLFDEFQRRFSQLGIAQAEDLLRKTTDQVMVSQQRLDGAQQRFDAFVRQVGMDLLDLKAMGGAPSGDSDQRRSLAGVQDLLTPALADLEQQKALLDEVRRAEGDMTALAAPASFLRDRAPLAQARAAVLQVQLEIDQREAEITKDHPQWQLLEGRLANVEAEYRREWTNARIALEREVATLQKRVDLLTEQQQEAVSRLAQLTGRYVEYSALETEMERRRQSLAEAEKRQAEALHARAIAAQEAVLSVVEPARVGAEPTGPSGKLIVFLGAVLGLLTGLALAVLRHHYSTTIRTELDLARLGAEVPVLASLPRVHAPVRWMS